jgi:ATP-dependent DNA ligase
MSDRPDKTIVDTEIVALDEHGKPSFSSLQNCCDASRLFTPYAFDLLAYRDKDLRSYMVQRRAL